MHRHVVRDRFITKLWYSWLCTGPSKHLHTIYNTDSIVLQGVFCFIWSFNDVEHCLIITTKAWLFYI